MNYRKKISFFTVSLTFLFVLSSLFLKNYDITSYYYSKDNYFIQYILLKLFFLFGLFTVINSIGIFIKKKLFSKNQEIIGSADLILCSVTGVITLSVLGIFLGIFELLHYNYIIILFLILIFFSGNLFNSYKFLNKENIIQIISIFFLFFFIFIRSLIPFLEDGDAHGHYLNFYSKVIENNKIYNNNFWMHFAHTKGAGLNYLSLILSDLLASQLSSFLFILIIFLIILKIISNLFGQQNKYKYLIIIILSFIFFIDKYPYDFSFNKTHIQFSFLFVFIYWSFYEIIFKDNRDKFFIATTYFTLLFCGFAHHLFSLFVLLFILFLLFIFHYSPKIQIKYNIFFKSLIFLAIGIILSLAINYIFLGVLDAAFLKKQINIINFEKVKNLYGLKAILWPIIDTDGITKYNNFYDYINFNIGIFSRYSFYNFKFIFFIYVFIFLISLNFLLKKNYQKIIELIYINLPLIILLFVTIFANNPSLSRGLIFINFITSLNIIYILNFVYNFKKNKELTNSLINYTVIVFFVVAFNKSISTNGEYFKTLILKQGSFEKASKNCIVKNANSIDCNFFNFLNKNKKKEKIYSISQSGGLGAFLPRPGIINEPYFNNSKKFNSLERLSNKEIYYEFKKLNINYLIIDMKRPIYNINNYISSSFLKNYTEIADRADDIYLLKLEEVNQNSDDFYDLFDLKNSLVVNYFFSQNFEIEINKMTKKKLDKKFEKIQFCLNNKNYNIIKKSYDTSKNTKFNLNNFRSHLLKKIINKYKINTNSDVMISLIKKPENIEIFQKKLIKKNCKLFKNYKFNTFLKKF